MQSVSVTILLLCVLLTMRFLSNALLVDLNSQLLSDDVLKISILKWKKTSQPKIKINLNKTNSKETYNFVEILKKFNYTTNSKNSTDKRTSRNSTSDSVCKTVSKEALVEKSYSSTNSSSSNPAPINLKNE